MSDSDYRQHMAEYFRMRAEGSSSPDYSPEDNHPQDGYDPAEATPSEIEWGAEGQYEPTTNYSLEGYEPIDSVVVEAPLGHGVAFDLGAEGRPYPDASVPDIFEDLPRQNAEISGVDFQADAIIEGTEIDSGEVRIEPLPVQEGRSLEGYTAMDSVVEQAPLGYGVPQWYGRAEGSAGDQVVSWEDGAGVSSPSAPPSDIFWAESKKERMASGKPMHFAIPSEKKYPIWDKAHARMALAWSRGTKYADRVEKAVSKRFPTMAAEGHSLNAWGAEFAALGEPDAPYDQGYDDQQDESIGERHQGAHEQSLKDRRDEADAMDRKTGRKYHDVGTMDAEEKGPITFTARQFVDKLHEVNGRMYEDVLDTIAWEGYGRVGTWDEDEKGNMVLLEDDDMASEHHKGQGYDDEMDESLGMRHRGPHKQSFKDRRDEAAAMDKKHSRMGRKYDDVAAMDSEHHKGQGYDDELDESLGMSHKESGMKQSFKDRRDESKGTEKFDDSRAYSRVKAMDAEMDGGKDWNMGLTQYAGSAGGSGAGTPVSYGGIALPESAVAELVESSTDNPLDATMGTVMGTMGAEGKLARKKSKNPSARQRGRAATQGTENDPCAKSDRACPQDKALWQKSKQRASKEYRVWPSPHASAYAVQLYNEAGGKWKGATKTAHPAAHKKNLGKNSLGNYYDGKYERKGDKGKAVDFSDKKTHVTHGDCGRAYTKDMSPEEFRKSFPRCLPQSGAAGMTAKGQKKETLKKRARLNKRKFRGGRGVEVPVDRKAGSKKKK